MTATKKRGVGQKIGRGETRVPRGEQTQSAPRRSKMSEGEDLGACVASFSCRTPSQDSLRNVVFFVDDFGVKQQRSCLFFLSSSSSSRHRAGRRRDLRVVVVVVRSIDRSRRNASRTLGWKTYVTTDTNPLSLSLSLSLSLFFLPFFFLSVLNNLSIDVFKTTNKKKRDVS